MKNRTVTTPAATPVQTGGHAAVSARADRFAPFSLIPQAPDHDHAIAVTAAMNRLLAQA
jgi:hypothetical protein